MPTNFSLEDKNNFYNEETKKILNPKKEDILNEICRLRYENNFLKKEIINLKNILEGILKVLN